jgi:hypothetical protein
MKRVIVEVIEGEGFSVLKSGLGRPINKNSVFEVLTIRRSADIFEETSAIAV